MKAYDLIRTDAELAALLSYLRGSRCVRVAIDMEGENNLHCYGIHVSLIQLFDGRRAFAVDALSLESREPLRELLEGSGWLKVMFDAANDLLAFQHALDIRLAPIVDVAIAARLLRMSGGLQALARQGGTARSKDRFQRANWMRRPLTKEMLDYAMGDVLPLLDLADSLMEDLARKGLMFEFLARNWERQIAVRTWNPLANYTRIPGYHGLSAADKRFARVLWHARENYARQRNLTPESVASKPQLKRIIDHGLRDPEGIAEILNEGRDRPRIDTRDFGARFAEAEREVDGKREVEGG